MLERVHVLETQSEVHENRLSTLEKNEGFVWKAIEDIRVDVGRVKVDVSKVIAVSTIIQAIATGVIVWSFTRN